MNATLNHKEVTPHKMEISRVGHLSIVWHRACNQCVSLTKFLQVFNIGHTKTLHKNKMHVHWHIQFRFWHVVWLVKKRKEKNHTSIETLEIEMIGTTRHVTLRWHLKKNVDVNWHFGFGVEHQIKFLKYTHCLQPPSPLLNVMYSSPPPPPSESHDCFEL